MPGGRDVIVREAQVHRGEKRKEGEHQEAEEPRQDENVSREVLLDRDPDFVPGRLSCNGLSTTISGKDIARTSCR